MTEREEQAVVVLNTLHDNPLLSDIHRQALEVGITAIKALEEKPCEDCISRQALKRKLQGHHDFFIHAYNGFSNMPQNDKSRVDEITNCIAMVVNEPPVTPKPKTGHWVNAKVGKLFPSNDFKCSECGNLLDFNGVNCGRGDANYCPNCGCHMVEPQESEE